MCKRIVSIESGVISRGDQGFDETVQSLKDVQELWFVHRVLKDQLLADPFKDPMLRSNTDAELPEESGTKTAGRDAQFELLIAAIGVRAGLAVTHAGKGQPDWIMATTLRKWSIEAKRVKSDDAFIRRVTKAASQIKHSGIGGVIAVDISSVDGIQNRRLRKGVTPDQIEHARNAQGETIRAHVIPRLRAKIRGSPVGMLIVHDFLVSPAMQHASGLTIPWGLHESWYSYHLEDNSSTQRARYEEFWQIFQLGLPNL